MLFSELTIQEQTWLVTGLLFVLSLISLLLGSAVLYHRPTWQMGVRGAEVVLLWGATMYGFNWLSVQDPAYPYDWHALGLSLWYVMILIVVQPNLVSHFNRRNRTL